MQYKKLIRKNVILEDSLKVSNSDILVPTKNINIVGVDDPKKVYLPTVEEVVRIANELKNVTFNVKYKQVIQEEIGFPEAQLLTIVYNSSGILVRNFEDTETVLLLKDTSGIPPSGNGYDSVASLEEGDGILLIISSTGSWEVAGYVGGGFVLDTSKSSIPTALDAVEKEVKQFSDLINNNTNEITKLSNSKLDKTSEITSVNQLATVIDVDNKVGLKQNSALTPENGFISNTVSGRLTELKNGNNANAALATTLTNRITVNESNISNINLKDNDQDAKIAGNISEVTGIKSTIGADDAAGTILNRIKNLEDSGTNDGANYISSILKYVSDTGTSQLDGGNASKAVFNLADLKNANSGTEIPKFNFEDESMFKIKIRFTVGGITAPGGNRNLIFNINTGDVEPTILLFNDRSGTSVNNGVYIKAQLTTTGQLTLEVINVDGTPATYSIIDFPTITINQIEEMIYIAAGNVASQAELGTVNTKINTNISDISALKLQIGNKAEASTTYLKTEVDNLVAAKLDKTNVNAKGLILKYDETSGDIIGVNLQEAIITPDELNALIALEAKLGI